MQGPLINIRECFFSSKERSHPGPSVRHSWIKTLKNALRRPCNIAPCKNPITAQLQRTKKRSASLKTQGVVRQATCKSTLPHTYSLITARLTYDTSFAGSQDYGVSVTLDDLNVIEDSLCKKRNQFGCTEEFSDVFVMLMSENNLRMPESIEDAEDLYVTLLQLTDDVL